MAKRNTYIANFNNLVIPAGGFQIPQIGINSACRRMFLTSVIWTFVAVNLTTGLVVPKEMLTAIFPELQIGVLPAAVFSDITASLAPPPPEAIPVIALYQQGQYYFNDIKFDNQIFCQIELLNNSAVDNYESWTTVIIETKE